MNILDTRTVISSYVISNAVCAVIMMILWIQGRKRAAGLGFWLADYIMQFLAVLLIALRGIVPDFASIVVANALVIGGTILLYMGLERYLKKSRSQYHNFILLFVFICVHSYFTFVQASLIARNINATLGLLIICLQCVWLLLRRVDSQMRQETRLVGVVCGAYCLFAVTRLYLLFTGPQSNDFFKTSFYDTLVILIYQMLFIGLTFALFLMFNYQLFAALERDTIERKQAKDALKISQEKFLAAFQNIPDAILITSIEDGLIIEVNDSFFRITEYSKEETIGKTTLDLNLWVSLTDREKYIQLLQDNVRVDNFETGFRKKSGKLFNSLISGEIIRIQGLECILTVIHDITELKLVELSLQQRLMELETVSNLSRAMRAGNNVQELIQILLDETLKTINAIDGCMLLFDPATNNLKRIITRGWFDALADISVGIDEGIAGRVFTTNQPYVSSDIKSDVLLSQRFLGLIPANWSGAFLPIQCNEGTLGVLTISVPLPRKISENELRLLTIISQLAGNAILRARLIDQINISNEELHKENTQRMIAQAMLAEEKELLSTTLMNIGEGVIVTDVNGLIILFNSSAETMTGYTAFDVVNKPLNDVFQICNPNTQQLVPNVISTLHEMNESQKNDISYHAPSLITRSGDRILISGNIESLTSKEGELNGYVIVFQNITERQKAEAQTIFSQKMEAIGHLAAGIAHEINTPIQYIGDNLRFLNKAFSKTAEMLEVYQKIALDRLGKPINQEDVDFLDEAKHQKKIPHYIQEIPKAVEEALDGTERVRKIVLAMREFSHPSEKEKKLSDINHGIESTVVISRNEWKYCAEMEMDLAPDLPLVSCQIDEINQVVLNMIVNAAQSIQEKMPEGSEQKGKILIRTHKGENKVLIIIQDTGAGIPEAIRMRIFDPFFTTKGVGKGTGQGLSMAYNIIVNKHHGRISVESEMGQSTTFTIELPVDSMTKEQ